MINTLLEFFGIIGIDITPPQTVGELFPYMFTVILGFAIVGAIFNLFSEIVKGIMNPRRFM